jgi:hypothetical protein
MAGGGLFEVEQVLPSQVKFKFKFKIRTETGLTALTDLVTS